MLARSRPPAFGKTGSASIGEHQPDDGGQQGHEQRFGEELQHQPPFARAQHLAHADFALAPNHANVARFT